MSVVISHHSVVILPCSGTRLVAPTPCMSSFMQQHITEPAGPDEPRPCPDPALAKHDNPPTQHSLGGVHGGHVHLSGGGDDVGLVDAAQGHAVQLEGAGHQQQACIMGRRGFRGL